MKKQLFFEPPKKTPLYEYITIKYGKIRDVHIVQLAKETPQILIDRGDVSNENQYLPLKNFHSPLKLERVDKYISKQKNKGYTHEIILPTNDEFDEMVNKPTFPPGIFILKGIVKGRKIFIKLNIFEILIIDYFSFSWSKASTAIRLSIIAVTLSVIAIISSILVSILLFVLSD